MRLTPRTRSVCLREDMERAPLKCGIIGCGAIAHEHVRFIRDSPRAEFVAAVDRSPATAGFFRDHYGAQAAYCDAAEMFAAGPLDVVHVLTPPHTHGALVRMALDAGCHVVCEKPMAVTETETDDLLAHAALRQRLLVESNNTLWNTNVMAMRRVIERGDVGEVREVEIAIALDILSGPFGDLNLGSEPIPLPAGAVHDFLPHMCGLFLHLAGVNEVDRVLGRLACLSGNPRVKYDYLDCSLQAGAVRGWLRFATDVKPAAFRLTVRGTKGSVETDQYNPFLRITGGKYEGKLASFDLIRAGKGMIASGFRNFYDKIGGVTPYHGLVRMLDGLYAAIQEGGPSPVTPQAIKATARLVERVAALPAD